MARLPQYNKRNFSPLSQILAYDPSGQVTSLIPGQSLLDYIGLPEFNEALINRVQWFTTNDVAKIEDLPLGRIIYTGGNTTIADGGGGHYVVVESGGSVVLDNGFELLLLPLGDLTGSDATNADVTTSTGPQTVAGALDSRWISSLTTVAQMVAATDLAIGDRVRTSGYTTSGDDGGNDYEIVAGGTGTADGGSFIDLDNGLQAKGLFSNGLNVKQFGAVGDGVADDTLALQAALDIAGDMTFPDGLFITDRLHIRSNTAIWMQPGTEVRAKSGTYDWFHCVFNMDDISNVSIHGNNAKIRMLRAEYPLQEVINGNLINSEFRHCVKIYGSTNIYLSELQGLDAGGDGFTVGGNVVCRNIVIDRCIGDNNRRQGISVTNAIGCWINGGEYRNTNGLPPERGVDIEPNSTPGYFMQNIHVNGVTCRNNEGGAVLVAPNATETESPPFSVFVTKCTSIGDGGTAGNAFSAIAAGLATVIENGGEVIFQDCIAIEPKGSGFVINRWNNTMPRLKIIRPVVINPGVNPPGGLDQFKCGLLVRVEPGDTVGQYYGKFEVHDLFVFDDRDTAGLASTYYPVFVNNANSANQGFEDVLIDGIKTYREADNWEGGTKYNTLITSTPMENFRVLYKEPFDFFIGSHSLPLHAIGTTTICTVSSVYTLPEASTVIGSSYSFRHDGDNANLIITPNGADQIFGYSAFVGSQIMARKRGSRITLKASAGGWIASEVSGGWATGTFAADRYQNSAASAAPTTGTWERGDRIWNSAPVAAGKVGWVCVTAGTPGTWKAFGVIDA